jgi:hypothetical protein
LVSPYDPKNRKGRRVGVPSSSPYAQTFHWI